MENLDDNKAEIMIIIERNKGDAILSRQTTVTVADVIDNTKTIEVLTANDGEKSIYDIRLRKSLMCT